MVALALPHDRLHLQAVALFEDARAGECQIRLPVGAIHEGRERARREMESRVLLHSPHPSIDVLMRCDCVSLLDDPRNEQGELVRLRDSFRVASAKSFDRYVLAAILVDRAQTDRVTPAIFCSINTKEFKPSGAKGGLPTGVYRDASIHYSETFEWRAALPIWRGKFAVKLH